MKWPLRNGGATYLRDVIDTVQTVQYSDSQRTQQQYWHKCRHCRALLYSTMTFYMVRVLLITFTLINQVCVMFPAPSPSTFHQLSSGRPKENIILPLPSRGSLPCLLPSAPPRVTPVTKWKLLWPNPPSLCIYLFPPPFFFLRRLLFS